MADKKEIDPNKLNQKDFWIYDAGYRAGFLEKDKEISDLKKEHSEHIKEYEKAINNEWKNCDAKLANRDKEWVGKIDAQIKHLEEEPAHLVTHGWINTWIIGALKNLKKEMGVKG